MSLRIPRDLRSRRRGWTSREVRAFGAAYKAGAEAGGMPYVLGEGGAAACVAGTSAALATLKKTGEGYSPAGAMFGASLWTGPIKSSVSCPLAFWVGPILRDRGCFRGCGESPNLVG